MYNFYLVFSSNAEIRMKELWKQKIEYTSRAEWKVRMYFLSLLWCWQETDGK